MTRMHVWAKPFPARVVSLLFALGVLVGAVLTVAMLAPGYASADSHTTGIENVVVTPSEIDFHEDTTVWFYGSGFVPGTEVRLIIEDAGGVRSDINGQTNIFPVVANDQGAWAASWELGRFAGRGVGGEGVQSLYVLDEDFNELASAPFTFCALTERAEDPEAEVPEFCSG